MNSTENGEKEGTTPMYPQLESGADSMPVTEQPAPLKTLEPEEPAKENDALVQQPSTPEAKGTVTNQPKSEKKELSSGFCDCCDDVKLCFKAFFCPCLSVYSTEKEL